MQKIKKCSRCKKKKSLSEFTMDKNTISGYSAYCKNCSKEYNHKRRKKNPKKFKDYSKQRNIKLKQKYVDYKGGKCQVCGYSKCLAALEFHHINPEEKEFQIGRRGVWKDKRWCEEVKKELDKCICVCANCHREIHHYQK